MSADLSDLLSSNMAVQLSSWSILGQAIQNSKSNSTKRFKLHFEVVIATLVAVVLVLPGFGK